MPDFVAFFAAAMIVVFHSVNAFRVWDNSFPLAQGVSFFFVLSGFILTYVYPSLSGGHRIRDFYVARIARIWPAHFVAFLLPLWLMPSAGWVWRGEHCWQIGAANLFLVHGWIPAPSYYFSFNSVSWSISTEAFFYLAFPFLICRLDRSWWWKLLCTAAFAAAMLRLTDFLKLPTHDPRKFLCDNGCRVRDGCSEFIALHGLLRVYVLLFVIMDNQKPGRPKSLTMVLR